MASSVKLERLLPPGAPVGAGELVADALPPRTPPGARPYVVANMIATVDGVAAIEGGSTALGGSGDKALFGALRGAVDAVLAGTHTVAAERYRRLAPTPERRALRMAAGLAADPLMVLITRSGKIPFDAPLFDAPEQRVVIACPAGEFALPPVAADVTLLHPPTPATVLAALRTEYGIRTLLCEGGPRLLSSLIAAGLLDELFLTLDPSLTGGEGVARILGGDALPGRVALALAGVARCGDELLLRYRIAVPERSPATVPAG